MKEITGYTITIQNGLFGTREIIEKDFRPVFSSDEEKKNAKQRIEQGLHKIFSKYCEKIA